MLVAHWRMILKNSENKPRKRKTFRKDKEGNYWISTMRFTKGTLLALGIVAFIISWVIAGSIYGNDKFFDDFSCGELERYLMGEKMGYFVDHKDLPESQHLELHILVAECKDEARHLNMDSLPDRGINLGMLGEMFPFLGDLFN
jgi:hypothetical protein